MFSVRFCSGFMRPGLENMFYPVLNYRFFVSCCYQGAGLGRFVEDLVRSWFHRSQEQTDDRASSRREERVEVITERRVEASTNNCTSYRKWRLDVLCWCSANLNLTPSKLCIGIVPIKLKLPSSLVYGRWRQQSYFSQRHMLSMRLCNSYVLYRLYLFIHYAHI